MAGRPGIVRGDDGKDRCFWGASTTDYAAYHDREWGFPVTEETRLFEKICLEGFQAGLSWLTILRKRESFRKAFAGFDLDRVAGFTAKDVRLLLGDAGIVRHRGKIESTINNARRAMEVREEFSSLAAYFWSFEPDPASRPRVLTRAALLKMPFSAESVALSKDLKRRGFSFVGPTTIYAFMQAMGLVNDHLTGCQVREKAEAARVRKRRPKVPTRPAGR